MTSRWIASLEEHLLRTSCSLLAWLVVVACCLGPNAARALERTGQLETSVTRSFTLKYRIYLPSGYEADPRRRSPLILYLHGGSIRGDDIDKVGSLGLPRYAARHPDFPFIVVAPLLAAKRLWTDTEVLVALIDEVERSYPVDPTRVYLTGHSIGGNGAWYLAYQHPERFAAVVTMAGPALPWWATRLAGLPIKIFHGDRDDEVPIEQSRAMVRAIESEGGHADLVVLRGRNHFILDTYEDPALYDWLLQHRKEPE